MLNFSASLVVVVLSSLHGGTHVSINVAVANWVGLIEGEKKTMGYYGRIGPVTSSPIQSNATNNEPQRPPNRLAMTNAVAVEPAPLVWARSCAAVASFPPPRRRRAAGAIRASTASGRTEGAGELPAPLLPNARRRGRDPLWHGGGFSLGVDLGDARTGLAVGRGITLPRPLTVRTSRSLGSSSTAQSQPHQIEAQLEMTAGSEAPRAEARAYAARRGSATGDVSHGFFSCALC